MPTANYPHSYFYTITLTLLVFLSGCATQVTDEVKRVNPPVVLNDVAYSQVLELATTPPDKVFSYGADDNQALWLYFAAGELAAKGNIIFIHGGCWLAQFDIGHTQAMSNQLAAEGYNVFNIEYRRAGNGGEWPVALKDILLASQRIFSDYPELFETLPTSIMGHSAGGHLAMLAGAALGEDAHALSHLKIIGLAPIVDVSAYAKGNNSCQSATPLFMRGSEQDRPNDYQQASPLNIRFDTERTYTLIGGKDTIVPAEFATHPDAQQIIATQAGHFDWIHPQSAAFKQVLQVLDEDTTSSHPASE